MTNKQTLSIPPTVAAYVRSGSTIEQKMAGFDAAPKMTATDRVTLLFCLSKDAEATVRAAALSALAALPSEVINQYVNLKNPHSLILDTLHLICNNYPDKSPLCDEPLKDMPYQPDDAAENGELEEETIANDEESPNQNDEEFLSKYKMAQLMGIGEKIKMALSGDKEWRSLLVKDSNKLVSGSVIKNPRITEAEILNLIKAGIQNDEISRLICANKEWIKNYSIRKALIENNRTPVQSSIRYLGTMGEKDLAYFAKSKNVASVISTLAKRLLLNKKK